MPLTAAARATTRAPRSPFNRIICTAVAAGLLSGVVLTGVQKLQVTPIILQAEVYEDAADAAKEQAEALAHQHAAEAPQAAAAEARPAAVAEAPPAAADALPAAPAAAAEAHEHEHQHGHDHEEWKPENGIERTAFTVLANVTMAIAFGLMLSAAFTLRGVAPTWRQGLLWSAACYAVFFLAPSLGLPPEVPGTAAAPLAERQLWWLMAALSTAGALALLAFSKGWAYRLVAAALLVTPHLVGAPQPQVHASAAPEALAHAFIYATALSNAVLWLVLGSLTAYFYKKFD